MAKFLFVVPPFMGHINPTLGVGAELLARGHSVIWVGIQKINEEFIPTGGLFLVPDKELEGKENIIANILEKQDNGPNIHGVEIFKFAMEETYIPFCDFMVPGILRIIDEVRPDVIIHDENMFAGAICAALKDIPYATSIAVPPGIFQPTGYLPKIEEWQTQLIIDLQNKWGIEGNTKIVYSKNLNLVYSSKEFVNNYSFGEHYKFVGPIIKGRSSGSVEFEWEKLNERKGPKIYISLGTVLHNIRKEFFAKIVDALADQPVTIIAATDPNTLEQWPDNFIVQSFVPQSDLMKHIDAIICHGGFNTVNESLLNGIPLIIIPLAYDQFHIASLVVNSGSGLRLRYRRLHSEDIKSACTEILKNIKYKEAAGKISVTLKQGGGTDKAADHLEILAKQSKKISPALAVSLS